VGDERERDQDAGEGDAAAGHRPLDRNAGLQARQRRRTGDGARADATEQQAEIRRLEAQAAHRHERQERPHGAAEEDEQRGARDHGPQRRGEARVARARAHGLGDPLRPVGHARRRPVQRERRDDERQHPGQAREQGARAEEGDHHAGEGRPGGARDVHRHVGDRDGGREHRAGNQVGNRRRERRKEHRQPGAEGGGGGEHHDRRRGVRDRQPGERRHRDRHRQARRDEQPPAIDHVGDGSGEQREHHAGQADRGLDGGDRAGRAGACGDDVHRPHGLRPDDDLRGEERQPAQAEPWIAQRRER
jgi:hypothetical protein